MATFRASPSGSESLARTSIVTAVFPTVVAVSSTATGGSLGSVTLTLTVAVTAGLVPSSIW